MARLSDIDQKRLDCFDKVCSNFELYDDCSDALREMYVEALHRAENAEAVKTSHNSAMPKLLCELENIAKEEESVMNSYSFRRAQRLYAVIAQLRQ